MELASFFFMFSISLDRAQNKKVIELHINTDQ